MLSVVNFYGVTQQLRRLWKRLELLEGKQASGPSFDDSTGTTELTGARVWDGNLTHNVEFQDIAVLSLDATSLNLSGVQNISIASTGGGLSQGEVEIRADQQLKFLTPAVLSSAAAADWVLTLTDPVSGQTEFKKPTVRGGTTDPNGLVAATGYAIYIQKLSSTSYQLWVHIDETETTTWI